VIGTSEGNSCEGDVGLLRGAGNGRMLIIRDYECEPSSAYLDGVRGALFAVVWFRSRTGSLQMAALLLPSLLARRCKMALSQLAFTPRRFTHKRRTLISPMLQQA
jgi:hypothetical protein